MAVLKDTIPSFKDQGLDYTVIPNDRLSGKHVKFNGAIIEWQGRRLLGYRRYDPSHGRMNLAISVLGDDWMPTGEHHIPQMPCKMGDEKHEDVRLFVHKGRLWLSCAEVWNHGRNGWHCSQRVMRLDDKFQPDHNLDIMLGRNFKQTEKNWMFFSQNNRLYVVYDLTNNSVYEINDETGEVMGGTDAPMFYWPFGHMRGGNAPQLIPGLGWLTFLHSATDNIWAVRRYSMSVCIMAPEPPFTITQLSKEPICYGTRCEEFCGSGNGQCVFPSGMIIEKDKWHVSAGINDTFNIIFHLDPEKVKAGLVDSGEFKIRHLKHYISKRPKILNYIVGPQYLWTSIYAGQLGNIGLLATDDPFAIRDIRSDPNCTEIPQEEYEKLYPKPIPQAFVVSREDAQKHYDLPTQPARTRPGATIHRGQASTLPEPKKQAAGAVRY